TTPYRRQRLTSGVGALAAAWRNEPWFTNSSLISQCNLPARAQVPSFSTPTPLTRTSSSSLLGSFSCLVPLELLRHPPRSCDGAITPECSTFQRASIVPFSTLGSSVPSYGSA
ncbi:hypothetical protein PHYPSEUDO_011645, partial [Phytophthora pseudosyringae]